MGLFNKKKQIQSVTLDHKKNQIQPVTLDPILVSAMFAELDMDFINITDEVKNDREKYISVLREYTQDRESRTRLWAWRKLRALSVYPEEAQAKEVLGFVAEVGTNGGIDYLAAYADSSARYYNFSGAAVIYEGGVSPQVDSEIQKLIELAKYPVSIIGLWEGARLAPPPQGFIRLNFLTPSGLLLGQGPMDAIQNDPLGRDVLNQTVVLLQLLTTLH
ncbi:MAG: hypothetical protein LBS74_09000 [Oscillospiraceae bacterium]|jgi:hypothetical protein|nr:hypothetical protein [Oscillospiraceae bacterium]